MDKSTFVFLPLGGSGEIGMNMNLYGVGPEASRQWIMIDCGVTFGDLTTPGVDLICPDPAYIVERRENLLGLFLTHGHEDHIGAVALLAPQLQCPIYATPFTAQLVERKLAEAGIEADLRIIKMGAKVSIGPFELQYITLTHSIPEPSAIAIRTDQGTVLHTGDWKIDPRPTLGPVTDDASLRAFAEEGIDTIVCDSTNVFAEGVSGSEHGVREELTRLIKAQKGRVAVTTFASNVSRVVSICEAAAAADRSVCLLGRSMLRITDAARAVGLLPDHMTFVEPKDAGYLPREHVLYLCTGSQGEPRAALARIARDDHADLTLSKGDTVIFSSKIIPGNERGIYNLQNDLVELGVEIITEKDEPIHVSGHPNRDELRQMYEWTQPRRAIPVHGEARHLEEHARFARSLGVKDALAPRNGRVIDLSSAKLAVIDEVPSGRLQLDGKLLLPEGATPMRERRKLAFAGVVAISLVLNDRGAIVAPASAEIIGGPQGLEAEDDLIEKIEEEAEEAVMALPRGRRSDDKAVDQAIRRAVRAVMMAGWGKAPAVSIGISWV